MNGGTIGAFPRMKKSELKIDEPSARNPPHQAQGRRRQTPAASTKAKPA
jgi:hypothetical protein